MQTLTSPLLLGPDGSHRDESPFAHLGLPLASPALCGYVPVRLGTGAEARQREVCVVRWALWE